MQRVWLVITALFLVACVPSLTAAHELHAVGVYEAHDGQKNAVIPISVDRPGKGVTLLLGSYDPLVWDITAPDGTRIVRIVIAGYEPQLSKVRVNGEVYETAILRENLDVPYQMVGPAFRAWVTTVPGSLGFEDLSSFQGDYRAKKDGYEITFVDTQTRALRPDYLKGLVTSSGPSSNLRIEGTIGGTSGLFKANGDIINQMGYPRTSHATFNAAGDTAYIYTGNSIRQISGVRGQVDRVISMPSRAMDVGHFNTFALDEKRGRLLALFKAGASKIDIMAYDLSQEKWSRIGSSGDGLHNPNSMLYVEDGDYFLVSGTSFSRGAFVGRLSPDGTLDVLRKFEGADFPGLTDLYDVGNMGLPNIYIAGFDGKRLALATDGHDIFTREKGIGPLLRIYVTDLAGGAIDLTYYEKPKKPKKPPFIQK